MAQFVLEIAHLHWLFYFGRGNPNTRKGIHLRSFTRLRLLIPVNKEVKSILGGPAAGSPVPIVLGNFRATLCGLVATSSNFCFSGQFLSKTMKGLEHISSTKKSTISQKTSSYAKFVSVNQK